MSSCWHGGGRIESYQRKQNALTVDLNEMPQHEHRSKVGAVPNTHVNDLESSATQTGCGKEPQISKYIYIHVFVHVDAAFIIYLSSIRNN